ncbi:MAG: helix-turn-helix domain-containing protein [Oscillospiraceae bacterium]|nr:helix-turn-helix domain-containing protein [Oscillospiraceae bacterium]
MNVGEKIQEHRVKNGLSQEALADKLGVTRQSVSRWELGQALPELDKVVAVSRLFRVTTDELLLEKENAFSKPNKNVLHLSSVYLIVKNFQKSIDFYEKFLSMRMSSINPGVFAEFYFDNQNISIMSESNLPGHNTTINDTTGHNDHKFVLNFWIECLRCEHQRVKSLNIGEVTDIRNAHTDYWYFNVYDPDNNEIEITGGYEP